MKKWIIEKDWLEKKYLEEMLSTRQIAKLVGCGGKTIDLRLKEFNIPTRNKNEALALYRNGSNVKCEICGKEIYRKKYNLEHFSIFFCSWECEKEHQSIVRRIYDDNNSRWRNRKGYKTWRNSILNRDKKCLICGSSSTLVAHHILEACSYIDLIYDINNGATLCQSCHIEVHRKDSTAFIKSLQEAILVEQL
jgi:hypothetical protein